MENHSSVNSLLKDNEKKIKGDVTWASLDILENSSCVVQHRAVWAPNHTPRLPYWCPFPFFLSDRVSCPTLAFLGIHEKELLPSCFLEFPSCIGGTYDFREWDPCSPYSPFCYSGIWGQCLQGSSYYHYLSDSLFSLAALWLWVSTLRQDHNSSHKRIEGTDDSWEMI